MKSFKCDSIEDLIFNKSFRNWVLYKQSQDTLFWENFIAENPDKLRLVNDSKAIIYALQINFKGLTEDDINAEIKKVLQKSRNQLSVKEEYFQRRSVLQIFFKSPFAVAISCLLIAVLSFSVYNASFKQSALHVSYESIVENEIKNATVYKNVSDTIQALSLPDNSRVLLSPKSTLSYNKNFEVADRKVYLSGEAFFEVSKNAAKPFFVFTNTIVTKVLGTSFRIKAYPSNKKSVVIVRTGKVSVIKASHFTDSYTKPGELGGVLITPNQQVTYIPENDDLNKSITEKPVAVAEPVRTAFVFDATPVKLVFQEMEDTYGIPVLFDEEILSSCSLSAKMGDEPFFDKLNIICKAINATYEIIDGNIVINSNGCK